MFESLSLLVDVSTKAKRLQINELQAFLLLGLGCFVYRCAFC
jgi:hypothetical protein